MTATTTLVLDYCDAALAAGNPDGAALERSLWSYMLEAVGEYARVAVDMEQDDIVGAVSVAHDTQTSVLWNRHVDPGSALETIGMRSPRMKRQLYDDDVNHIPYSSLSTSARLTELVMHGSTLQKPKRMARIVVLTPSSPHDRDVAASLARSLPQVLESGSIEDQKFPPFWDVTVVFVAKAQHATAAAHSDSPTAAVEPTSFFEVTAESLVSKTSPSMSTKGFRVGAEALLSFHHRLVQRHLGLRAVCVRGIPMSGSREQKNEYDVVLVYRPSTGSTAVVYPPLSDAAAPSFQKDKPAEASDTRPPRPAKQGAVSHSGTRLLSDVLYLQWSGRAHGGQQQAQQWAVPTAVNSNLVTRRHWKMTPLNAYARQWDGFLKYIRDGFNDVQLVQLGQGHAGQDSSLVPQGGVSHVIKWHCNPVYAATEGSGSTSASSETRKRTGALFLHEVQHAPGLLHTVPALSSSHGRRVASYPQQIFEQAVSMSLVDLPSGDSVGSKQGSSVHATQERLTGCRSSMQAMFPHLTVPTDLGQASRNLDAMTRGMPLVAGNRPLWSGASESPLVQFCAPVLRASRSSHPSPGDVASATQVMSQISVAIATKSTSLLPQDPSISVKDLWQDIYDLVNSHAHLSQAHDKLVSEVNRLDRALKAGKAAPGSANGLEAVSSEAARAPQAPASVVTTADQEVGSAARRRFRRDPNVPILHPSETNICFDHSNFYCKRGDSCRFVHEGPPGIARRVKAQPDIGGEQ